MKWGCGKVEKAIKNGNKRPSAGRPRFSGDWPSWLKTTWRKNENASTSLPNHSTLQIEVDKPLNLQLAPSKAAGGGLVVKGVRGAAAQAGLSPGDTIIYT